MPRANDALIPDLDDATNLGSTPPSETVGLPVPSNKKKKKSKKNAKQQQQRYDSDADTPYSKSITPSPPVEHGVRLVKEKAGVGEPTPPASETEPPMAGEEEDMVAWEEAPGEPQEQQKEEAAPEPLIDAFEDEPLDEPEPEPEPEPVQDVPAPKPPPAPSPVVRSPRPQHVRPAAPALSAPSPPMSKALPVRQEREPLPANSRRTSHVERPRRESLSQQTSPRPRKSFVEPANPPHMAQNHFYSVPGLDLGLGAKQEKGGKQAGSDHYCCCFDSFTNSGDAGSASKAKDALLVGWEGGLDVYRVLADKLEVVGRLEGLRGGVVGAKILPAVNAAVETRAARPLVAVIIHGPMAEPQRDAVQGDFETDEQSATRHYQTSVEIFSLQSQQHLSTLYRSLPVESPQAILGELATIPEPVGDLRLDAKGHYITLASGKSGEVFVFTNKRQGWQDAAFRCIAKYWTSLQTRFDVQPRPQSSGDATQTKEQPEPQTPPLLSLSGRWLAYVPPGSSSKVSAHGIPAVAQDNPQPPGLGSHVAPPQPTISCDVIGLNAEGVVAKFSRQAAQEIMKASRRGIEMGWAGWKEFTQPSPPSRATQHHGRSESGDAAFPPTNAPASDPKRMLREPAIVAIVDLDRLVEAEESHAKHLPPPLASFALEDGCNYLSLSADGLRLLTTSRKGEVSNIWDLHHTAHGSSKGKETGEGEPVAGPYITRVQRIPRNTQSVVLDAAWAKDGHFVALLTAHGTVHLHEISPRSQEQHKRRRRSAITKPPSEKADATVSVSQGLSPPSSNGFLGSIKNGWQSVSTQVNTIRTSTANSGAAGFKIPTTFSGFREVTSAGAAAGGRAMARGLGQGYSMAKIGAGDMWHADDNKIKPKDFGDSAAAGQIQWLHRKSGFSLAVACGGKVHVHPVQRVSRQRGESTFTGLKAERGGRREFSLPTITTAAATRANTCSDQGPHGFWSLRAPTAHSTKRGSVVDEKAIYETNPPFCPLYIDRRVSMLKYTDDTDYTADFLSKGHGFDDEQPWLFGEPLPPAVKLNERSPASDAGYDDDDEEDDELMNDVGLRGGGGGGEGVESRVMVNPINNSIHINSRRRKKKQSKKSAAAGGYDGEFDLLEDAEDEMF